MEPVNRVLARTLWIICGAVITVFAVGLWFTAQFLHFYIPAAMLFTVAAIVFFGLLSLPGNVEPNGALSEPRIRLAITATLLIVYLGYFCTVIFIGQQDKPADFAKEMLPTLTSLLSVAIPFYFGASAAVEISQRRSKEKLENETN